MATKKIKKEQYTGHTGRWTERGFVPTQKPKVVKVPKKHDGAAHDDNLNRLA